MRCLTVAELPPPPPRKAGWPWTEEMPPLPATQPGGSPWPRISIVTPSYNQIEFIEETIRSVLLQGYPNLEYFVIDGGSTEECVEIIRKYSPWLTYWVSEKDRGQAHAINKGLERCTGEIFQWINSDDVLEPGALLAVASAWHPGFAIAGVVLDFDGGGGSVLRVNRKHTAQNIIEAFSRPRDMDYHQPGVWLETSRIRDLGGFQEHLRYLFDVKFYINYLNKYPNVIYIPEILVNFRLHQNSKTCGEADGGAREQVDIRNELSKELPNIYMREIADRSAKLLMARVYINSVLNSDTPILGLLRLVYNAFLDPYAYINRMTAGAIKRLLYRVIRQND